MKTKILFLIVSVLICSASFAQMQKGDNSVGFSGNLDVDLDTGAATTANINLLFGRMLTDNIEASVGMPITVASSSSMLGILFSSQYYFTPKEKISPFIAGTLNFPTLITSSDNDVSSVILTVGGGLRFYLNKNLSIKTDLNLGSAFESYGKPSKSETSFSYSLNAGLFYRF